jgi:hypothetical protein
MDRMMLQFVSLMKRPDILDINQEQQAARCFLI